MRAVIFGGLGFIGVFFARHLIDAADAEHIYLFDKQRLDDNFEFRRKLLEKYPQITCIQGDVEDEINWDPGESIDLIANFAAVHREPGHDDWEYFRCNILGAQNICKWAKRVKCERIIFTSSIAPYGPSEEMRNEYSIPVPTTAYGASKLVAEKIHQIWQAEASSRRLVIARPGVVFGPSEGGNVSRLVKAVGKRYFTYLGNRRTRKAGVYIKELCYAMLWVLESDVNKRERVSIFNMTMDPSPSIEDYVDTIGLVLDRKVWVPSLPSGLILLTAYVISVVLRPFGIKHPFDPLRIKKLRRSNNIAPQKLKEWGYVPRYSLLNAFVDWKKECPKDWQ
jgi:nucleoside-diphosphate-sugar epimerase